MTKNFPVSWVRNQFPALAIAENENPPFIFSDNAAGAQMPATAIDAMTRFIKERYVLEGGDYRRSQEMEGTVADVRSEAAKFLGASKESEVIFGLNATTTLRLFATSIGETLQSGDEIIISGLEHEANVTPWLRLQKKGVVIKFWKPRGPEHKLQRGDLVALLSRNTKIVACTAASNLLGTMPDLKLISDLAHAEGAILVVDGVHFAPHRRIDVVANGIDFFVCSGYKIFGPRVALAYCNTCLQERLPSLNHFFLDGYKIELGAQNYEGIATIGGVFQYFHALGKELKSASDDFYVELFNQIRSYEDELTLAMLDGLEKIEGIQIYGITNRESIAERVSTFAFRKDNISTEDISKKLAEANISCRWGHNYAIRLVEHLKLRNKGGVVRISLCHYNTMEEVERMLEQIRSF